MPNTILEIGDYNISVGNGIFRESKYYTSSPQSSTYPLPESHSFDESLIYADEFLYYLFEKKYGDKAKSRKGDTYRTPADEYYTTTSQHSIGKAMDFNWADQNVEPFILKVLCHDFRHEGIIFQALLNLGLRGFGIYNTFVHLDARTGNFGENFNGTPYQFFDNRNGGQTEDMWAHEEFFAQYPEARTMCENVAFSNNPVGELDFLQSPTVIVNTTNSPTLGGINFGEILSTDGNTGINGGSIVYNQPIGITPTPISEVVTTKAKNGISLLGDQLNYMVGGFTMLFSKKDEEDGMKRYDWKQMATSFSSLIVAVIILYYFFKRGKSNA